MTNEQINKALATWAGLCWHESDDTDRSTVYCKHCGNGFGSWHEANPDYCSSLDQLAPLEAKAVEEFGYWRYAKALLPEAWDTELESNDVDLYDVGRAATAPPAIRAKAIYNLVMEGRDGKA